jgi:aspartyl-tRNA(Asn)/glutamyl-tRNA(Gln) amidotransferase subunit C
MSINEMQVSKIAKLARIAVSESEKTILAKELSKVLLVIEKLQEVDTQNTQRMSSVSNSSLQMRPDVVQDMLPVALIVKNAPISEYNCFVVPKVIE